ncbi:MarR family transcriptional regulator [Isoptericola sp. 4D.3]|jgi:MarR family transcriptional regulator, organic hydroperoxide resistance regulator|uniref:MarR family transcriptional regulator n=1 Tax=Isoptericola peretonis TaxID=2918523 RepID=A0ABT0IZ70_9MICO|nr:MarR family transcriptional regulator [Isoptericola sp. 4D.3]
MRTSLRSGSTTTKPGTGVPAPTSADLLRDSVLAGRRAARRAADALAHAGCTVDEWLVLDTLGRRPGATMSELRAATVTDKATLGRRVDALVTRALVYREVDAFDRRVIRVHLSSRGRDVLSGLGARLAEAEQGDQPRDQ